jgi:predicted site-specific integrase-resolvase/SAM-dependent methyltransferase
MQTLTLNTKTVDLEEAGTLLGVSVATIRNWIRHSYITPENSASKKMLFKQSEIEELKSKLKSGEINRLSARANKRNSSNTFIPEEYADNDEVFFLVKTIVDTHRANNLSKDTVLLALLLNLLRSKRLIEYPAVFNTSKISFKNKTIKEELNWWLNNKELDLSANDYRDLLNLDLPQVKDIAGLVYQSLADEGDKAQGGSYYTPKLVVDEVVEKYIKPNLIILDPCCGTGQFLLSASEKIKNPRNIWGFDIDEKAVRVARLNLLAQYPEEDFVPNIFHRNTLLSSRGLFAVTDTPDFDVVITNPPWGVHYSSSETKELGELYPSINSNEAFSYFIAKGLEFLKDGGVLSYILPESILNVKTHKDIREVLLTQTKIKKVKHLDRLFKNVFTPVIRLDVIKLPPEDIDEFEVEKAGLKHIVKQKRLVANSGYLFDVFNGDQEINIFDKVYRVEHTTLKNNAEWALGVVTGDNKTHLMKNKTGETEPILTGKEIKRFVASEPKNFIKFELNKFQQVAPEHKYRAPEKLIYKFISKDLVFSYDNKQTLTLNSANILIPKITGYPVKTILALFNSSLYQFIYQKKFGSIKILKSDLEQLPLPILSKNQHDHVNLLVEKLLDADAEIEERRSEYLKLDNAILALFSLSSDEQGYIRSGIKMSDKLFNI